MIKRQYNGRFKQQLNIRLVGLMWAMLAMMSIMALINPVPTSLIQLAFNHNPVAIGIFAIFTGGRGLIGLVQPKRYWRWFRAGVLNDAHNSVRLLSFFCGRRCLDCNRISNPFCDAKLDDCLGRRQFLMACVAVCAAG